MYLNLITNIAQFYQVSIIMLYFFYAALKEITPFPLVRCFLVTGTDKHLVNND